MKIIESIVPIPLENLKEYFEDKNSLFLIDYKNSTIKNEKFFTYLSNLELPCDINLLKIEDKEVEELFKLYLTTDCLVEIPSLEVLVTEALHEYVGVVKEERPDQLESRNLLRKLIGLCEEDLIRWCEILDSLTVYNVYTIQDEGIKESISSSFEQVENYDLQGINFVNLLKYDYFYIYYEKQRQFEKKIYKNLFNDNVIKGKNLYHYWATQNNPFHFTTTCILNDIAKSDEYRELRKKAIEESEKIEKQEIS